MRSRKFYPETAPNKWLCKALFSISLLAESRWNGAANRRTYANGSETLSRGGPAGLGVAHITPLPPAVVAAAMRILYSLRVIFVSVSSPPTCPQTSRRATESTRHSLPSPTPIGGGARSFSSRDVSGCGCDHTNRRGPPLKIGFQGRIRGSPGPVNLFTRPGNTLAPCKDLFLAAVYRSGCAVRP